MRATTTERRERNQLVNLVDGRPVKPCSRCKTPGSVWADVQGARLCKDCSGKRRPPATKRLQQRAAQQGQSVVEALEAMERNLEPMGHEQIAVLLGMTRENVRQIEKKALRKFRTAWKLLYGSETGSPIERFVTEWGESG